jgi:signal transduction histidine kinase
MLSRLRRPVGRLRDLPIWSKLGLIMIVPTIATIIVGTNGLVDHIETSNNADRARTLSKLSKDVGGLVHELQNERAGAALMLSTGGSAQVQAATEAYRKQFPRTDQAQRSYALRRTGLANLPESFSTLLRRLDNQMSALPALRERAAARSGVTLTDTVFIYRVLIDDLIAIRDSSTQLAGETSLSERMRASAAVASMKEFLSQERVVVLRALGEGTFPAARRNEFMKTLTGQEQAFQQFSIVATQAERAQFDLDVAGDDLRLADKYEGEVESAVNSGSLRQVGFKASDWDAALRERGNLLRKVEDRMDSQMETRATELRDAIVRQVLIETGLLLAMLLLAILFAWLVARSMARSLRELRHGALSVAQYGLPQAVARLRDPALATQLSPVQVAHQIAEPLPVRSKDEFGQVTEAFNAVHMEAVRTAAEQAALRSSVATMFVNLARRSQILVDRLIGHLDRLERGEEDPDRLAELFQLDHLATRMRRNDENLLVLAGADSTRVQREPAALLDVLRAAQSEVEHYTRIEFGVVDRDIEVAAHAVNDLVHLVAELLDNATAFSPPDSAVIVEARRVGDRAVLLVEDRGIGVSPEQLAELNERLATPPMVDATVSRMMGLVVVARLASRHGVRVELRPAPERGTIADVTLPISVLVPRALAGRLGTGREDPESQQPEAPARQALGPPLALESGPALAPYQAEPVFPGFDARPAEAPFPGFDARPSEPPIGRPFDPDGDLIGTGSGGPRGLPAWSDLTGAAGANGTDLYATPRPAPDQDPLPQRRPGESRTPDGEAAAGPVIPRQHAPDQRTNGYPPAGSFIPPVSAPPVPVSGPPVPPPAANPPPTPVGPAPPAWPPVAPNADEAAPPPVPGEFAAALDMTAEIPKVRAEGEADQPVAPAEPHAAAAPPMQAGPEASSSPRTLPPAEAPTSALPLLSGSSPTSAVPSMPATPSMPMRDPRLTRYADETMELPIFRELESAWFRTRRSVPEMAPSDPVAAPTNGAASAAHAPDLPQRTGNGIATGSTSMIDSSLPAGPTGSAGPKFAGPAPAEPVGHSWQTAADDGWRAATQAAEAPVTLTTDSGLPKRVPMAQLVPGGVDKGASTSQRRTPEAVRGLLSAYHRGVQRGRTQPKGADSNTPEPTTAGPQTSQAGKEQEA